MIRIRCKHYETYGHCDHPMRKKHWGIFKKRCQILDNKHCSIQEHGKNSNPPAPRDVCKPDILVDKIKELTPGKIYWIRMNSKSLNQLEQIYNDIQNSARSHKIGIICTNDCIEFVSAPKGYNIEELPEFKKLKKEIEQLHDTIKDINSFLKRDKI